jgi:hypothetical protein
MVTAIRLLEDHASIADVRLLNAAVRELRYAFRTFARYRSVRKVTTFSSARTAETEPTYRQAEEFAKRSSRRIHADHRRGQASCVPVRRARGARRASV